MENQTQSVAVSVAAVLAKVKEAKLTTPRMVVTHPGGAHRDDFIAAALLAAIFPEAALWRSNPDHSDQEDPQTWVVDIGKEHSPLSGNFDHHQLTREHEATCALTLILRALGLEEQARKSWRWLGFTETLDSKGPHVAAAMVGCPWAGLQQALSPVEQWLIGKFGEVRGQVEGPLLDLMRDFGLSLIEGLHELEAREALLAQEVRVLSVKGLKVLVAPESVRGNSTLGLSEFQKEHHPDAAISIVPSDRDKGLALYRIEDHPQVDFRLIKDHPQILFAHANGFCGGTREVLREEDLIPLLEGAITPPPPLPTLYEIAMKMIAAEGAALVEVARATAIADQATEAAEKTYAAAVEAGDFPRERKREVCNLPPLRL